MAGKSRSTHMARPTLKARHHPPGSYQKPSWNFSTGLSILTDYETLEREQREEKERLAKERQIQTAILNIKKQFGKNAILKGLNYEEGATAKERNEQIGGHKA